MSVSWLGLLKHILLIIPAQHESEVIKTLNESSPWFGFILPSF